MDYGYYIWLKDVRAAKIEQPPPAACKKPIKLDQLKKPIEYSSVCTALATHCRKSYSSVRNICHQEAAKGNQEEFNCTGATKVHICIAE